MARGIRDAPLVHGALRGFDWAVVVASLYAAVAVALLVLIAARSRARDLALVRTMGGGGRDVLVLSLVESPRSSSSVWGSACCSGSRSPT